jgi:ribosomal protein S12 methylthiotransferase
LKISKEAEGLARDGVKELILIALTYYGLDIYKKKSC